MRAMSPQEILSVAVPFFISTIVFVILMGSFYQLQVNVGGEYIPYKVASMVAHSLTGSTDCLALATPLPHKGWLDQTKVEAFASEYSGTLPACVNMPCWVFKAEVKDLETGGDYVFGYHPGDSDFWGDPSYRVGTNRIPVLLDNNGTWRHLGKLTINVRPTDETTCQNDIERIVKSMGGTM